MKLFRLFAAGLLCALSLPAQMSYGRITGRVTDASGAVVPTGGHSGR